ncbi:MAG: GNAT family N-acetyltransferase [Pseudozobellia sp.]|nr:GNAT family N-acetyltransferase [Pseudozobellia sp.]|tara:strand:+ start:34 stop:477 length:444 start_codon:yes stop_codon:yes gene_type:complete
MAIIIRAEREHLADLAPLFNAYRVFYGQQADEEKGLKFLTERFLNDESIVLLAYENETAVGFTQLYTTYSSVSLQSQFILNDLYVKPEFRKRGVGELLLQSAKELCQEKGFKGLSLETANDNPAQKLYEKLGWKAESDFIHYFFKSH